MPAILINMESNLKGEAVAVVMRRSGDIHTILENDPLAIVGSAFFPVADVLLLETTDHRRFRVEDRLKLCQEVRRLRPGCKIALLVNETVDGAAAERVKRAKAEGLIDEFIYDSTGVNYMTALLETLGNKGE